MRKPIDNLLNRIELEIGWIELWQSKLEKRDAYQGVADRLKESVRFYKDATGTVDMGIAISDKSHDHASCRSYP
jgi:hypothetical protein